MFNNTVLDVIIGLVFIYLLYSLLITILQEIIAHQFSYRAKFLEKAIMRMLEDDEKVKTGIRYYLRHFFRINPLNDTQKKGYQFLKHFYDHPLVKYLGEKPHLSKPSYLHRASFSKVIIDLLRGKNVQPGEEIRSRIQNTLATGNINPGVNITNADSGQVTIKPQTLEFLNSMWADSQGDVQRFVELLENWFDETMERTTGWYKKYIQKIAFFIGLLVAIIFNVDTLAIIKKLEKDPKLREQVVQLADAFVKEHPDLEQELKKNKEEKLKELRDSRPDTTYEQLPDSEEKKLDSAFEQLKKRGEYLQNEASNLVQTDIKKINNLLGIGYDPINKDLCKENNRICNLFCSVCTIFTFQRILGWLLTALALSLGAPFWFDLLNKLMKLRTSVSPSSSVQDKEKQAESSVTKIKRVG